MFFGEKNLRVESPKHEVHDPLELTVGEDFARAIEDKQVELLHPVEVVVSTGGWNPPVDNDTGRDPLTYISETLMIRP